MSTKNSHVREAGTYTVGCSANEKTWQLHSEETARAPKHVHKAALAKHPLSTMKPPRETWHA
eukprot:2368893-Amphidinium_carterae.1